MDSTQCNKSEVESKETEEVIEKLQITIYLSAELKEKLQQEAENKGYTINDLALFILHQYFGNIGQE